MSAIDYDACWDTLARASVLKRIDTAVKEGRMRPAMARAAIAAYERHEADIEQRRYGAWLTPAEPYNLEDFCIGGAQDARGAD